MSPQSIATLRMLSLYLRSLGPSVMGAAQYIAAWVSGVE
jgi:hypothetical protein